MGWRAQALVGAWGRRGCLEGLEWGEKGVLEGKRGGSGLFLGVWGAGERSKLCQVIVIF
jgi:hypothetical protein